MVNTMVVSGTERPASPVILPDRPAPAPCGSRAAPSRPDTSGVHPYRGHRERDPAWTRREVQRMRGQIKDFIHDLPTMADPPTARGVRTALGAILLDMTREESHSVDSTYGHLHSVRIKMDRVRASADPEATLHSERLDVPIPNYGEVRPGVLYRGAQPSRNGLRWLARHSVRTVVTLRMPRVEDSYGYVDFNPDEEAGACAQAGLRSIAIPAPDGGTPDPAQVEEFLRIVRDPSNWPVYVHCAAGTGRTGIMAGIYERSRGRSTHQVLKDAARFGLDGHSQTDLQQIAFLRSYPLAAPTAMAFPGAAPSPTVRAGAAAEGNLANLDARKHLAMGLRDPARPRSHATAPDRKSGLVAATRVERPPAPPVGRDIPKKTWKIAAC